MVKESKTLEERVVKIAEALKSPPSSVDELYSLLDATDGLLSRVEQSPSQLMLDALDPLMKALSVKYFLSHPDVDVKVSVASCISEITRITAPEAPYDDDIMKESFQMIVGSFEGLDDTSSRSHQKRLSILETIAKVRSCVVMLDLECDDLILQMFHHFLKNIRAEHSENVFSSMETIMTLVIEESEDISTELLSCLLLTVKKDNKDVLPIAAKLAEKVMNCCASKIKPYLLELVQSTGASLSEYSKVVASICQENSDGLDHNEMPVRGGEVGADDSKLSERTVSDELPQVSAKVDEEVGCPEKVATAIVTSPTDATSNGNVQMGNGDSMDQPSFPKQKSECSHCSGQSESVAADQADCDNPESTAVTHDGTVDIKRGKGRKTKSPVQLMDAVDRIDGGKDVQAVTSRRKGRTKKAGGSEIGKAPAKIEEHAVPLEHEKHELQNLPGSEHPTSDASPAPISSPPNSSRTKRGRPPGRKAVAKRSDVDAVSDPPALASLQKDHSEDKQVHDVVVPSKGGDFEKVTEVVDSPRGLTSDLDANQKKNTGKRGRYKRGKVVEQETAVKRLKSNKKQQKGGGTHGKDLDGELTLKEMASSPRSASKAPNADVTHLDDSDKPQPTKKHDRDYGVIVNAIAMYWGFPVNDSPSNNQSGNDISDGLTEGLMTQVFTVASLQSNLDVLSCGNSGRPAVVNSASSGQCVRKSSQLSDLPHLNSVIALEPFRMSRPFSCSEPFDEKVNAASCIQKPLQFGPDHPMHSSMQVTSLEPTDVPAASDKYIGFPGWGCTTDKKKVGSSEAHSNPCNYINYYSFGRIATSIFAELMHKSSVGNNNESKKSVEDIKSEQLKAISQLSTKGQHYAYQKLPTDVQKENCGWCLSCKTSSDFDCLFKVAVNKNSKGYKNKDIHHSKGNDLEGLKDNNVEDAKRLTSEKNKISHITFAVHHILSIERRAGSLLSGLWEKPHYSQHWRKAVRNADNVASLKPLLLSLELNLRRAALSVEWSKPVDDTHAVVSSSIVTNPVRGSSSYIGIRKEGKENIVGDELMCMSRRAAISDIHWWRGGRLSRQLFQCKMLPQALASKAGRQAGRRKIPHMLYPDSLESLDYPKRTKYGSWRVAVEMSQSVAQFMYQAKDFDANIKWSELSGTRLFPKLTKDSKKLAKDSKKMARRMKNVTICRKCKEGKQVKYLLDFGKRETVPPIVAKHGVFLVEPTVGRKRYWLTEAHVPLHLLKSYEEKKMKKRRARLSKKSDSGEHHVKEIKFRTKNRKRSEWLSYLVSKAQKSEKQLCGHCSKGVSIREAVNCHFCSGIFHRKHFKVPKGAVDIAYMCNKCRDTKTMNLKDKDTKRAKAKDKDSRNVKARAKDTKNVKAKEEDINNMNTADRAVTCVDVKRNGIKGVKAKKDIKTRTGKDKCKKIIKVEELLRRSERVKQKGIRRMYVKPQRLQIVLKRREVSEDEELDAIPKKGKHVLLKSKKSNGHKRGNKAKAKSMKFENIENGSGWHKRKRSVVHRSYWLNGLLWTRKSATEKEKDFRERNIILPFQNADPSMKPLCSLCCQEYNLGVSYICCEHCQDWFHGDAFCLTIESINNLVGFRCHKCRMRSKPICPFLKNVTGNVDLDSERKIGVTVVCNDNQDNEGNANVVINGHQDDEHKPCGSPIICKENLLDNTQREGACIERQEEKDEDHGSSHEDFTAMVDNEDHLNESPRKNVPEEELGLSSQALLTNGYTVGLQHRNNWESSCGEACADCSKVKSQDCMDEERSVVPPKKELALCPNTLLSIMSSHLSK